nr:intercellular adhesion molecule 5-like isoform X1 [Caretta caretta]
MRPRRLRPPAPGRCLPLLLLLALPGAAEEPFNVSVRPEDSVVEHGGAIWLNCSTTCQDPGARGGLETSLTKAQEKRGPRWEARELVNIWEWVSAPQCYFFCYGKVTRASAHITTYRVPERVGLERIPELERGRAYNLTCRVLNVAPVRHLTVTLRQGGRTLHTETFQNRTRAAADNVTVTHEIIPQRQDHGQEVTCHSALDLRPLGQLFQNSSSAVELRVFALPEEPQLQISHHIEVGDKATARCDVTKVFPAAGEARFTLSFGGERLNFTVTTSNDTATAQGEVRSLSAGERQLTCTVSVGPVSRSAGQSVLVYSFPQPVLEIDQPRALVNRNVSLTCCSPASQPPGTTLQLRDSERTLASGHQPCLQLTLTARKGDNGRQFTCEGNLALGSHSFVKNTSAQLIVLYKPTLDESGCPSHQTWLEGTQQQLACEADGNPTPEVSCRKDSQVYDAGSVQNVTRGHAGVYRCSATNVHGTAGRNVTIHVEYGPEMDNAGCARTQTWVEETEQSLACLAWGNPAPAVVCTKDGAPYGVGVQRRVAREHAGTYHCTAANTHGSAHREVTVRVEYKPSMDELSCPSAWTWVKGMPQAFSCDADGIPAPEVVCTKDGVSYRLGQGLGLKDPMGTYQCNATNPHGSATKTVTITLEYKPTMDESSCPSTRAWLEGTLHTLACEADGIPVPRVPCAKEGAADEFSGERNVSRNDSGTYWCTAINRHGSARRAVTVRVEYRPVVLLLAVSPSATVPRGANFNISCRAEGSPAPAYRWTVPPAPNVHCSADNSTVSVAGADRHNRGVYVCRVSNAHGQHLGRLQIQVTDNRLIVAALTVGVAVLLLGGTAGLVYYLKSTACKKGEYNVQDAESSSKATCLGRDSAVYGIQLMQT